MMRCDISLTAAPGLTCLVNGSGDGTFNVRYRWHDASNFHTNIF